MFQLKTQIDCEYHLKHVLEEELGITFTPKAWKDLKDTMRRSNRIALKGCVKQLPGNQIITA